LSQAALNVKYQKLTDTRLQVTFDTNEFSLFGLKKESASNAGRQVRIISAADSSPVRDSTPISLATRPAIACAGRLTAHKWYAARNAMQGHWEIAFADETLRVLFTNAGSVFVLEPTI